MDADKLLRRVDLKREHLNSLRLDPEHRKGWGEALEFFTNTICVLIDAEEREALPDVDELLEATDPYCEG